MIDDRKPRKILAERVDVYQNRHGVQDSGAYPNECFILITDNKESIFVGEKKELIELEPTLQLMKEMGEVMSEAIDLIDDSSKGIYKCDSFTNQSLRLVLEKYRKFLEGIEK